MPRFFFDDQDGRLFVDDEGIECATLEAARREALRAASSMLAENSVWDGEEWKMKVRDQSGAVVATLLFSAQ